jgi:transposase
VLSLPSSVRMFVATQTVDGRKGADSLAAMVRSALEQDPLNGHLYVFFSKRRDRVRIVYWDHNGFAMWTKRFEIGRYHAMRGAEDKLSASAIDRSDLLLVVEGIDLAGARRRPRWEPGRAPGAPEPPAYISIPPDWACEVLSDSTEAIDRGKKMRIYRREGVRHLGLLDPRSRTLEVWRLDSGRWREVDTWEGDVRVRPEPCMGRRMCATAANLVEHVLPEVSLRQWVLTSPFPWRRRLAHDGAVLSALSRLFVDPPSQGVWTMGVLHRSLRLARFVLPRKSVRSVCGAGSPATLGPRTMRVASKGKPNEMR